MPRQLFPLTLLIALTGCSESLPPITGCEAVGDIRPVCGMQSPEDIAALDDGQHLLLAHFGGMGGEEGVTGSISVFDTQTETYRNLYPGVTNSTLAPEGLWGDENCTEPPGEKFSPHGTHLHQLQDGRWRYLVVNHGGRESVELFELQNDGGDSELTWRGCVLPPEQTVMNDVVGLDNGDLIYTRMFQTGGTWEMLSSVLGAATGELWRWSAAGGAKILPGTEASQPNGLEISADNRYVFANMYIEGEVWKINADTGEVVGRAPVSNADNSAWGSDGRLWLVRHAASFRDIVACFGAQAEPCPAGFEIVALDPDTMEHEVVFSHSGAPMGAATVAVPMGGRIYLGSFVGDRLISIPDFTRD